MPFESQAQAGYFHTHKAELAKQGVNVDEWDAATKGKKLPKRKSKYRDVYNERRKEKSDVRI